MASTLLPPDQRPSSSRLPIPADDDDDDYAEFESLKQAQSYDHQLDEILADPMPLPSTDPDSEDEEFVYDGKDLTLFDSAHQPDLGADYLSSLHRILDDPSSLTQNHHPPRDPDHAQNGHPDPHPTAPNGDALLLEESSPGPSEPATATIGPDAGWSGPSTPAAARTPHEVKPVSKVSQKSIDFRPANALFNRLRSLQPAFDPSSTQPSSRASLSLRLSSTPSIDHSNLDLSNSLSNSLLLSSHSHSATGAHSPSRSDCRSDPNAEHAQFPLFRWASLRRISNKIYPPPRPLPLSSFGKPTVIAASGLIAVGAVSGSTLVFDYASNVRSQLPFQPHPQHPGPVSALAISHDHTFLAVGHAQGHIFLYDLAQPALPARSVPPTTIQLVRAGRSEGHLCGSAIIHIAFVGLRHTAIISADAHGLAFYHALGQVLGLASTDVRRILGNYPEPTPSRPPRKQTCILGAAALPLGPVAHPTDHHALVALLTSTKLVIVGLKPTPRTWWRSLRASTDPNQSSGPGCLCWFPSTPVAEPLLPRQRRTPPPKRSQPAMDPHLAFAWGSTIRFVTVLSDPTSQATSPTTDLASEGVLKNFTRRLHNRVPHLRFVEGKRWVCEAQVLGIQWLSWRIICVMTTSHFEVIDTQIWQRTGYERLDIRLIVGWDQTLSHTVVPDGSGTATDGHAVMSGSFKAYKGKIFLLTTDDLRLGMVVSWAEQILELVEQGSLTEAIDLTCSYWLGRVDLETVGLPSEDRPRQALVGPKLREMVRASAEYMFSAHRVEDDARLDVDARGVDRTEIFEGLVRSCAQAAILLGEPALLFDDVYEHYLDHGIQRIFFRQLEPFVLRAEITELPTAVTQALIDLHAERAEFALVDQLIRHIEPGCLDIHHALAICTREGLYDAIVHIYTEALGDFVAPMVELLGLIRSIQAGADTDEAADVNPCTRLVPSAYKIFAYLAAVLSGHSYPNQTVYPPGRAKEARHSVCGFLFSGHSLPWPAPDGALVLTGPEGEPEPTHPYLRALLRFDAEAMLDTLDGVFEQSWMHAAGAPLERQTVVNILLELIQPEGGQAVESDELGAGAQTFVRIFVARNVPKYAQFLKLTKSTMDAVLVGLATDPDWSTRRDRELAAECLLSAYKVPTGLDGAEGGLVEVFRQAGFWRILRGVYGAAERWAEVVGCLLEEPGSEVFEELSGVFGRVGEEVVVGASARLAEMSVAQTAALVERVRPECHALVVARLDGRARQFAYLRALLEPEGPAVPARTLDDTTRLQYVGLLCEFEPRHVLGYLQRTQVPGTDVEGLVEVCMGQGVYEGAVWVLGQTGQYLRALEEFGGVVEREMMRIVGRPDEAIELIEQVGLVADAGAEVCVGLAGRGKEESEEQCWGMLLSTLVGAIEHLAGQSATGSEPAAAAEGLRDVLRRTVATLMSRTGLASTGAFGRLVSRLVERGGGARELRAVVLMMVDGYAFQSSVLGATARIVDGDLFGHVGALVQARQRGVRPAQLVCARCGLLVVGGGGGRDEESVGRAGLMGRLGLRAVPRRAMVGGVRKQSIKGKEVAEAGESVDGLEGVGSGSGSEGFRFERGAERFAEAFVLGRPPVRGILGGARERLAGVDREDLEGGVGGSSGKREVLGDGGEIEGVSGMLEGGSGAREVPMGNGLGKGLPGGRVDGSEHVGVGNGVSRSVNGDGHHHKSLGATGGGGTGGTAGGSSDQGVVLVGNGEAFHAECWRETNGG